MLNKFLALQLSILWLVFAGQLSVGLSLRGTVKSDASVPGLAAQDEIWLQTYQILGVRLREHLGKKQPSTAMQQLARRFELAESEVSLFISYALNYTAQSMSVEKVLLRYPHYNAAALAQDFAALAAAGLITSNAGTRSYSATDLGRQLVAAYWPLKLAETARFPTEFSLEIEKLAQSLEKVAARAAAIETDGSNESIKWRRVNRSTLLEKAAPLVKVFESYGDLVAYVNDNAHYRFDRLAAKTPEAKWQQMALTALAKELLAAMRSGRQYRLNQCIEQRNWRQPRTECERAVAELKAAGLIAGEGDAYQQTALGSAYFQAAEALTNERLYRPWAALSQGEYEAYKAALVKVGKMLAEEK